MAYLPIEKLHNPDWSHTNIVGSLCIAKSFLSQEECLVFYSDIFFEESAIESMLSVDGDAVLSVVNWLTIWKSRFANPLGDLESFKFNPENLLLSEIGKSCESFQEIEGQFGGVFKLTPQTWSRIEDFPEDLKSLDTTSLLQLCVSRFIELKVVPYFDSWAELDNINDIETQT